MKKLLAPLILFIFLLLGVFLFTGCASSEFYHNGRLVAKVQSNITTMEVSDGDFHLRASGINNSTPTRAGGSVLGTGLAGAVPLVTAAVSHGL